MALLKYPQLNEEIDILLNKLKIKKEELKKEKIIPIPKSEDINDEEIPFEIPNTWRWVRLSDISIIQEGPGIRKFQYTKEGIRFLTVTNITENGVDLEKSKKYIAKDEFEKKYMHFKLNKGDIVCACSGASWGKTAIFDDDIDIMLNTSTLRLRFFGDIGNNIFLFYLTKTNFFKKQIEEQLSGQQPNFGISHYSKILIPLPPLSEQKRIVVILDKAFEKITKAKENAETNLNSSNEIFESYLQSVFENKGEGWEEKKLGEVCEIINGGTPDTRIKDYWDGQNLWITPKDMGKLKSIFVDKTIRKITDSGLKNCSAKLLPINSIILSSRAPIGHLAINTKPMSTNQGCKGIVPKKNLDFLFLYHFLKKSVVLLNSLGSGTTFKELSGSKLAEVLIPFPPLKRQQVIVKKLDKLSQETKKLEAIYEKKLLDLEELKQSILQKAFKGELTGASI